jgi:hypothetical protein
MKRTAPIKRTSPLKRKAALRSKPSTLAKNRAFRKAVLERDEMRCRMNHPSGTLRFVEIPGKEDPNGDYAVYFICGKPAVDAAHVFSRAQCGRAKYDPDVAIASCRKCH